MVTSYSNTASFLTLLAPSNQCYTTDIVGSGGYSSGDFDSEFGGTSAACPYAAGAVACLQSAAKDKYGFFLSPSEVKNLLTSTGTDITDGKIGIIKPRIDLALAIDCIGPPVSFDFNVAVPLNTAITIALQAADDSLPNPPGDLNYVVVSLPAHGDLNDPNAGIISSVPHTLAGNASQVIYTPATDYIGPDSFTFKANDGGTPPDGGDSNSATVSINVNPPRSTVFYEDFESGLGDFTIDNDFGDGSGLWHLTSVCDSVLSGHSTPNSIYYGRDSACDYNDGQTEGVVTSSDINLAGVSAASLEFKYMLQTEQFPGYDIASVQISVNGGDFTEDLNNIEGTLQDPSGGWVSKTLDLSSMADSVIRIRFRFRTVDDLYNDYPGFYVDDVNVTGILLPRYTISGFIKNDCNLPVSGVIVDANNGGASDLTDANGRYEIVVNYGWSGTITPSRLNYTFEPDLIGYNNVLTDIPDQNYVAIYIYDLDRNCTIGWGDMAVLAENWLKIESGIVGDFDNDNDVDFIDFAEFGLIWY